MLSQTKNLTHEKIALILIHGVALNDNGIHDESMFHDLMDSLDFIKTRELRLGYCYALDQKLLSWQFHPEAIGVTERGISLLRVYCAQIA